MFSELVTELAPIFSLMGKMTLAVFWWNSSHWKGTEAAFLFLERARISFLHFSKKLVMGSIGKQRQSPAGSGVADGDEGQGIVLAQGHSSQLFHTKHCRAAVLAGFRRREK